MAKLGVSPLLFAFQLMVGVGVGVGGLRVGSQLVLTGKTSQRAQLKSKHIDLVSFIM